MDEPGPGRYEIDPARSTVAFRTRHFFGLGAVHGEFPVLGGVVEVRAPFTDSRVQARIDARGFATGNGARDGVVRSPRYLDVEHHPLITFTAGRVTEVDGRPGLDGELTVRGVTRPVRPRLDEVRTEGGLLRATATVRIDRREFGLTAQPGLTGRHLDLTISVTAAAG